jgi:hypothetical protein
MNEATLFRAAKIFGARIVPHLNMSVGDILAVVED